MSDCNTCGKYYPDGGFYANNLAIDPDALCRCAAVKDGVREVPPLTEAQVAFHRGTRDIGWFGCLDAPIVVVDLLSASGQSPTEESPSE